MRNGEFKITERMMQNHKLGKKHALELQGKMDDSN